MTSINEQIGNIPSSVSQELLKFLKASQLNLPTTSQAIGNSSTKRQVITASSSGTDTESETETDAPIKKRKSTTYTSYGNTTKKMDYVRPSKVGVTSEDSESDGPPPKTQYCLRNIYYKGKGGNYYVKRESVPRAEYTIEMNVWKQNRKLISAKTTMNKRVYKDLQDNVEALKNQVLHDLDHVRAKKYQPAKEWQTQTNRSRR